MASIAIYIEHGHFFPMTYFTWTLHSLRLGALSILPSIAQHSSLNIGDIKQMFYEYVNEEINLNKGTLSFGI